MSSADVAELLGFRNITQVQVLARGGLILARRLPGTRQYRFLRDHRLAAIGRNQGESPVTKPAGALSLEWL